MSHDGVLARSVFIPCRHLHTSSEMVDYRDVENAVRLLVELLSKPVEI